MRLLYLGHALIIAFCGNALARGYEGHRVIAEIAEQYLDLESGPVRGIACRDAIG